MFNACAIAASSAENGFCSALAPNVTERVFSFSFRYRGGCLSIATPNLTSSFRAELLVAICINPPGTVGDCGVASTPACTRTSHGANVNGGAFLHFSTILSVRRGPIPAMLVNQINNAEAVAKLKDLAIYESAEMKQEKNLIKCWTWIVILVNKYFNISQG
jgi:hypothetical protein